MPLMPWVKGPAGKWEGGVLWEREDGLRVFVIRKQIDGHRFQHFLPCTRLDAALEQLSRFQADPAGYDPAAPGGDNEPLRLTVELVKPFLAWSGAPARESGKGNSRPWVLQQKAYLSWWAEKLKGRDLRRLSVRDDIIPTLDGVPGRKHRIEVLKAFFTWMRKERHLVSRTEDVTLDLTIPASRPEQWKRPKAIPRAHYLRVVAAVEPKYRDALALLDETGWHVSELVRFIRAGAIEPLPVGRTDGVAVIVCPQRKSGEVQKTVISEGALAPAQRLRDRGEFSVGRFYDAVRAACAKAKVTPFTPGRFRHTLATRAIEAGADPGQLAAYMGWKTAATGKRWYWTLAAAPRVTR